MKLKTLVISVAIVGLAIVSVYSIAEYSDYSAHKIPEVARVTNFILIAFFTIPIGRYMAGVYVDSDFEKQLAVYT